MKSLSVVLATYNEENNIAKCLKSVKQWCAEIIVVDGTSSDKTPGIAKSLGAKVYSVPNRVNFHINKKIAIDKAKGDWILQLDADEIVSSQLKQEILDTVNNQQPKTNDKRLINGYWIPRKNYFLGKWLSKGGQYPDFTLRLYKNGKGRLPAKSVHEQAVVDGKTGYLKEPLLHYPYPDFGHYMEHFEKYTAILAGEISMENSPESFKNAVSYIFLKPTRWFLLTYIRHKGFIDGWPGFIFSFYSALRFPVSYIKYLKKKNHEK